MKKTRKAVCIFVRDCEKKIKKTRKAVCLYMIGFAFSLKKITYIIIKFYSLGVVAMYWPEGPQNCRTGRNYIWWYR
jgi:hypothetical protein